MVLTGQNGAGKTHLLEAIKNGTIQVSNLPRKHGTILNFDWTSFSAKVTEDASPDQVHQQRESAISNILKIQHQTLDQLPGFFRRNRIVGGENIVNPKWLSSVEIEDLEKELTACILNEKSIPLTTAKTLAQSFIKNRDQQTDSFRKSASRYGDLLTILEMQSAEEKISILALSETELRKGFPLTWQPSNTLQLEFANWFSAWHAAHEYNKINRYYNQQEGEEERPFLEEAEFRKKYGNEPWDIANNVLAGAGFRHRFTKPKVKIGNLQQQFQLRLEDPEDGTMLRTNDLSSGEKILLAITLMLYQSSGDINLVNLPGLLLLDEIDAPLHPSFTRALIDTLSEKFVKNLNVAVIMTTHSPSTVALAPSDCVYELVRNPRELRKCSVSSATQILSAGFISVTPSDIVVITESSDDPEYYRSVYSALSVGRNIPAMPSLTFIAASARHDDGKGGGAVQVKNWAPKLHALGLERFKGLIDRDNNNQSDSIVSVLLRYSIENYLFDPLTLSAYILHRGIVEPFDLDPRDVVQIRELIASGNSGISAYARKLTNWLSAQLSTPAISETPLISCDYLGFTSIEIPEWWIKTRGHDLEGMIRKPLNDLGQRTGRGALFKEGNRSELITFQSQSYPELLSRDFISIFTALQTSPDRLGN